MMKKRTTGILIIILTFFTCTLLSGCGNVYKDTLNRDFENTVSGIMDKTSNQGGNTVDVIRDGILQFFASFRSFAPVVIICCWMFGFAILLVVKKNKKVRKNAIFGIMIGIPFMVIIIVYGSAFILQYVFTR